ncbi:MAG: DNA polymerase III subunit beta [Gammaproteobacteria bacterium]|nr:DNA polymerase III subunit beta [Gammaproteobacteria bacterium]
MKFIVSREALLKPLALVAGVAEKRHTLPILSQILITLKNQTCILTGTDSEVELTARLALEHATEDGCFTAPARKLLDICRALPEGNDIEFTHENQRLTVKSGKARFNLSTLPAHEFPHIETTEADQQIQVNAAQLQALFKQTHFAMALQDVRYFLNGALFELSQSGEIKVVATDGHRLALSQHLSTTSNLSEGTPSIQSIIPRKAVMEILRLFQEGDETLTLHLAKQFFKITSADYTLITKLIDGRYPDYRKVIPRPSEKFLTTDREQLQQALNCIAVVTSEKYRGARVQICPQTLKLVTKNPEQEEAEQEVAIHEQTADNLEIGFNVSYLLEALNAIDHTHVKITFSDADNGIILESTEGKGGRYVVMPMRL